MRPDEDFGTQELTDLLILGDGKMDEVTQNASSEANPAFLPKIHEKTCISAGFAGADDQIRTGDLILTKGANVRKIDHRERCIGLVNGVGFAGVIYRYNQKQLTLDPYHLLWFP